jgi:DNA-binding response OmpR family regulator
LFVTGDALAARTLDFLERHQLPYVHKPFRVEELTQAVRSLLETASPQLRRAAAKE